MQIEDIKKWLPMIGIGLPLVWLAAYTWAWSARHGCEITPIGECWVTAVAGWGADVVMLRWMDTTLGAGALAVLAASAVFINSSRERAARLEDARLERHEIVLQRIAALELALRRLAAFKLLNSSNERRLEALTEAIEQVCAEITHVASPLANHVVWTVLMVEEDDMSDQTERKHAAALLMALIEMLKLPQRYFVDGRYKRPEPRRLTKKVVARMGFQHLKEDDVVRLRNWLSWED